MYNPLPLVTSRLGNQVITVLVEALAEFAKNCKHTDSWKIFVGYLWFMEHIYGKYMENIWKTGWWFGTFGLFFHNIWNHHPNWLSYFSEGLKPSREKGQQLVQFDTYHHFGGLGVATSRWLWCFAPKFILPQYYDLEL